MKSEGTVLHNRAAEAMPMVDVLKFLFAVLIMCLHGEVFMGSTGGLYFEKTIVRLAVPFFFIASGFFYGKKVYAGNDLGAVTKTYVSRLAMKLLIFEPISILIKIAQDLVSKHLAMQTIAVEVVRNILFYPLGALWYIQAVIVAIVILVPFMKKGREDLALVLGLVLYQFALLCNRYYFLCEGTAVGNVVTAYMQFFISARNGVFVGLLYVSMGVVMAKKWDVLQRKGNVTTLLVPASLLCLLLEVHVTNSKAGMDDNALFLTHLLLVPALFLFAGRKQFAKVGNYVNAPLLRNLSTSIYLLHRPALQVVKSGFEIVFDVYLQPWQVTAIAAVAIAFVCFVIYWKKWKPFYNWIK